MKHNEGTTMSDQETLAVVLSIYDAFRRGDVAAILSTMDPKAELKYETVAAIPWTGNRQGHDGWGTFFQTVGENLEDVTLTMEPFAVQGDHIVVAGRYQAKVKKT